MLPLSEYKKHGYATRKQYMLPGMDPDTDPVAVVMVELHEVSVTPVKKKRKLI